MYVEAPPVGEPPPGDEPADEDLETELVVEDLETELDEVDDPLVGPPPP